ncbi:O-antigen ligase family protein [Actimicrobium sp. CCC2.4]|uniref:O-antigen ligase family protein n=1 Tax=Actimicrobium sp. CCC2.4 TaxID=3048606 RepID=UPI002AC9024B|nr:O-antigen ligase family protein [Actimicrobium sp. CCC2.4]MEB0136031.1 O-antigen ligase family protein [Actimicrobium sp. CCC2.4]WPX32694.1 O-antigen ligase family protein [Actimicrobium sp. CCC2.4]
MHKFFDWIINPNSIAVAVVALMAVMVGSAMPIYVGLMGAKISNLLIPPILLIFVICLALDRKKIIIAVILFRSAGDVFLETTKTSFGGVSIGIGAIINLVVLLIAFLLVVEKPKLFPKKLALFWLPFLLMALFSVANAPVKIEAIRFYLTFLSYFAIFIIAIYLVRTPQDFNKLIRLVVWSSVLPALYALVDIGLHMRGGAFRLQGTFSHPNILAFYLVLVITLSLYLLKTRLFPLKTLGRLSVTLNMIIMIGMLLLTQTRSAWVACFLIFFMYALFFERKYFLYLLITPIFVLLIPSVRDRLVNLDSSNEVYQYAELNSFSWRISLWESALGWMETLKYLAGYGLESFKFHSRTFFLKAGATNWGAHNIYVQLFFEMGILGLLAFLSLFANISNYLRRIIKIEPLAFFILLSLIAEYLVVAFSDNTLAYLVFNWYMWVAIGAGCSVIMLQSEENNG